MKHYLQFKDLTADEYAYLLSRAAFIKAKFKAVEKHQPFADPDKVHQMQRRIHRQGGGQKRQQRQIERHNLAGEQASAQRHASNSRAVVGVATHRRQWPGEMSNSGLAAY